MIVTDVAVGVAVSFRVKILMLIRSYNFNAINYSLAATVRCC